MRKMFQKWAVRRTPTAKMAGGAEVVLVAASGSGQSRSGPDQPRARQAAGLLKSTDLRTTTARTDQTTKMGKREADKQLAYVEQFWSG